MAELTLEQILVKYQMCVTGRPGPDVDANSELTTEMADAIRRVLGHDGITLNGQQLMLACGFAGIYIHPEKCSDHVAVTDFTFENSTCVDDDKYKGKTVHQTERPDLGYQPLEPNKWPHVVNPDLLDSIAELESKET